MEELEQEIRELEEKAETLRPSSFIPRVDSWCYNTITWWLEYRNFLSCAIRGKKELEKIIEKAMNKKD